MDMLYPKENASLYIPLEQDGQRGRLIFEATHRQTNAKLHWHLDNQYLGETYQNHIMELNPPKGAHRLVLVDAQGNELVRNFEVISED